MNLGERKGQVAIFVIVAIAIVVGIVLYVVIWGGVGNKNYPQDFDNVFNSYLTCIQDQARNAIDLAGTQGGYVNVPNYMPGSEFAPFSSQMNFMGSPVPYWYYISGNGIVKEQVPTKAEIENQIEDFIAEGIKKCDFERYYQSNYTISRGEQPSVDVVIKDTQVSVVVSDDLTVTRGKDSATKRTHSADISTKFGKFYALARTIYDKQKKDAVFEMYANDVLRLYAPVDGVEIQCGPKIWNTQQVLSDIRQGLEDNFMTIKFKGGYYDLKEDKRKYFVIDESVNEAVNVIYSKNWPTKIEIQGNGVDDAAMVADPVGTQEGMGMMGFCYVPYHFVYDLKFPVLVQIYDNNELFEFPVVVVIEKNLPRNRVVAGTILGAEEEFDLCAHNTQEAEISLYDSNLNVVEGNVSFECFDQRCRLGETTNGKLRALLPACVNGYISVRASGYADKKQVFSSNSEMFADVLMEREHEIQVEVEAGGKKIEGATALVSFTRDDGKSASLVAPETKTIKLSEGNYDVKVYVYGNSSITIPASSKTQCVNAPRDGLLGFVGMTKEQCFDVKIPETKIDYALIGGGISSSYLLESELNKGKMKISVAKFTKPTSMEQLANNFEQLDSKGVGIEFYG